MTSKSVVKVCDLVFSSTRRNNNSDAFSIKQIRFGPLLLNYDGRNYFTVDIPLLARLHSKGKQMMTNQILAAMLT